MSECVCAVLEAMKQDAASTLRCECELSECDSFQRDPRFGWQKRLACTCPACPVPGHRLIGIHLEKILNEAQWSKGRTLSWIRHFLLDDHDDQIDLATPATLC